MNNKNNRNKKNKTVFKRMNDIKSFMKGKCIESFVDFDQNDTEYFQGTYKIGSGMDDKTTFNDNDTRTSMGKRVYDLYKVITEMNGDLSYIKSGANGHTFKGKGYTYDGNKITFALKVVAYPKTRYKSSDGIISYGSKDEIYDEKRPENAELKMMRLLSLFTVKTSSPHIVLPIATFNTKIDPFISNIDDIVKEDHDYREKYIEFVDKYKKNKFHDEVSILMSEWANCGDFGKFCKQDLNYRSFSLTTWKVFFFQIIVTLALIQDKYPSFRHNDLKPNNILIDKLNVREKKTTIYSIRKIAFVVPFIGYHLKIWDFDFACIPGIVDNSKVEDLWTSRFKVDPVRNQYYDMHYFFNSLTRYGFIKNFFNDKYIPDEVKKFVYRVVPEKLQKGKYVHERGRLLVNKEYTTPFKVLCSDPFFEDFRNNKKKNNLINKKANLTPNNERIKRVRVDFDDDEDYEKDFEDLIKNISKNNIKNNHDNNSIKSHRKYGNKKFNIYSPENSL